MRPTHNNAAVIVLLLCQFSPSFVYGLDQCNNQDCKVCLKENSSKPVSYIQRLLRSYIEANQIIFDDPLNWRYNQHTVIEARHIYISIIFMNANTGTRSDNLLLFDCCNIPLMDKGCVSDVFDPMLHPFDFDVYIRISLYRESINMRKIAIPEPPGGDETVNLDDYGSGKDRVGLNIPIQPYGSEDAYEYYEEYELPVPEPTLSPDSTVMRWLDYTRVETASKYSYVCVFHAPKETVTSINVAKRSPLESVLFNRGVYKMAGFTYANDQVINTYESKAIECESKSFTGIAIYNITSKNPDNSTFTCLLLWLTMTANDSVEVNCMPHNATYPTVIHKPIGVEPFPTTLLIVVTISGFGGIVLVLLMIFIMCHWKRKLDTLLEENKNIPESLKLAFQDDNLKPTDVYSSEEIVTPFQLEPIAVAEKMEFLSDVVIVTSYQINDTRKTRILSDDSGVRSMTSYIMSGSRETYKTNIERRYGSEDFKTCCFEPEVLEDSTLQCGVYTKPRYFRSNSR
uniref:uncharacterized protein LOC113474053 isoform X2 n=1 Tax=Ciona intestinalis TaxID=7719 RepID=UPI000EF50F3A|nr:uncharacterized protein LOC113474053 isoform X2 [Ciona intestinalis]|eukprot:XP_026694730.1 uncharacterized protein LOC113474053 isoform X2 [Ciona intestinalis]